MKRTDFINRAAAEMDAAYQRATGTPNMTDNAASREARALRKFVQAFDVSGGVGAAIPCILHDAYLEAKLALADEAASQPREDGYATAFYEIAAMLGIGAQSRSPGNVWANEMRPRLLAALHDTAPTDQAQRGEVEAEALRLKQFNDWSDIKFRDRCRAALAHSGDPS
jgi:hypothetical protein